MPGSIGFMPFFSFANSAMKKTLGKGDSLAVAAAMPNASPVSDIISGRPFESYKVDALCKAHADMEETISGGSRIYWQAEFESESSMAVEPSQDSHHSAQNESEEEECVYYPAEYESEEEELDGNLEEPFVGVEDISIVVPKTFRPQFISL
mmetsp:Transcript_150953/g.485113  ORF Transcript_150953/g.485113 Transcript_150953/m.485113 type:complete len:151 (+) Transcript_150953:62-514(+)|eukprot:CAMPEP_0203883328 /NCGR_PEP_ID=MMETSP0359-20131031/27443_1 /ASSEMBLY_ACC=CAM_ASM_000338 /TAXON_ID=268821 /ORGANISM="Scrippsiella Hangoei, Strain SHTV-5" /LENGTH=150 /DNA_ID=CAMNT_0050803531 /DNA_START=38 /DNA_END=490 /DNA_ORIENTATION=+